jgi:hypothetical protein
MKKLYQGLMIIATAALMACSSMEVNDAEAVSDNYPSDFNASVYLELHPLLQTMQIMDYVKDKNAQFKASMDANTFKTKAVEDSIAFIGDTATVHRFYVSPRYVAYPEEKWDSLWIERQDTTVKKIPITKISQITLDTLDSAGTTVGSQVVYVDSLVMDSTGDQISEVYGKLDTAETETKKIEVDNATVVINSRLIQIDTIDTKDSLVISKGIPGITKDVADMVLSYNIYGVEKDIDTLNTIVIDMEAVARQYIAFGQSHGWAYRRCNPGEQANPEAGVVTYPATKLYCDDNGVVREIK